MSLENSPSKILTLKKFDQDIVLTTSKSHSNRALILGAIKGKNFKVHNISTSSDVVHMLSAFKKIGLRITQKGSTLIFENSFPECEKETEGEIIELHTGDGGTTNRFLIALLSRGSKEYYLYPTEKMSERPIEDLVKPLQTLNVTVMSNQAKGTSGPWIKMKGPASLYKTTKLEIDCQKSTQFASALMLAFSNLPLKFDFINLVGSEAYIKMTTHVIKKSLEDHSYTVPVDFSSLGYPAALAALMGRVCITNCSEIDIYQADSAFMKLLKSIGASVSQTKDGLIIKKGKTLKPFTYNIAPSPDLFPTLVFLAAHIDGVSTLSHLEILQYKESDRLAEMVDLMMSFGVDMEYSPSKDTLKIKGQSKVPYNTATIRPARDHRIVMAAALFMAKNRGGELFEVDCVEKSFPTFFDLLK